MTEQEYIENKRIISLMKDDEVLPGVPPENEHILGNNIDMLYRLKTVGEVRTALKELDNSDYLLIGKDRWLYYKKKQSIVIFRRSDFKFVHVIDNGNPRNRYFRKETREFWAQLNKLINLYIKG